MSIHQALRLSACAVLVGFLAAACGGKSAEAGNPGNGASGAAGNDSEPGGGTGGSMASAGSPGSGGTSPATAGAPPSTACTGPAATGMASCAAAFQNWTHDGRTGVCQPIIYGGCGATENNYSSLAECQAACPGRASDLDACEHASDCTVQPSGCCGCFGQTFTAHDLIAYNRAHTGLLDTCDGRDVACTPCPDEPDGAQKFFVPACIQGQCAVLDVRESSLTACKTPADCKLRRGTECCEPCGESGNIIAVSNDGSFEEHVCSDPHPGCPECGSDIPENTVATCDAGHCGVIYIAIQ